ncbi:putative phosphoenolpyruvate carboxykinase (ATP) [Rosa chinensis]|uniref:phosphoenolpyruvate carboxykinase (ATP) n=1 Tax=Rosa chinensis TaxID=74649 RepID=A0A2P6SPY0_ROSCH|nr:putative phosphoenolpyruvate carboxykinase (ATP) [Rosa chinensis]
MSNIYVHDGAVGSSLKAGAKVRVISDSPSAVLSLSSILWGTPTRAVSHDSRPLTVYVATSISPDIGDIIGLELKGDNAFIAADIERSSLVLCGNAFSDSNATKQALAALSGPVIFARRGLPLSARLLVCGDLLVPGDIGVILSSEGVAPLFQTGSSGSSNLFKLPVAVVLATFDSSGVIPSVSKLAPGQAAYHFLAGYQNGKFMPAYSKGPSSIDLLELAKEFLLKLKDDRISSYLVNANGGEKGATGKDFARLVESTLSNNIPPFQAKGGNLQDTYKSFLSSRFGEVPEEFSF